jgi:hypothetical protein
MSLPRVFRRVQSRRRSGRRRCAAIAHRDDEPAQRLRRHRVPGGDPAELFEILRGNVAAVVERLDPRLQRRKRRGGIERAAK